MARLTFAEIRTQGGVLGGNDTIDAWILIKMNAWLRKHYAAWPWPFLVTQATGIVLAAGLNQLDVGAVQGGLTPQISRLFSPIYFRADGFSTRSKAPLRQLVGGPSNAQIGNVDSSTQIGAPAAFTTTPKMTAAGLQYQQLNVYPYTDKQYTLSFTYQYLPDDLEDTDVPLYPNEMTLIQAAKCATIEYDRTASPLYVQETNTLAGMVTADRDAYGGTASFGDMVQLDDDMFPTEDQTGYVSKMGW